MVGKLAQAERYADDQASKLNLSPRNLGSTNDSVKLSPSVTKGPRVGTKEL